MTAAQLAELIRKLRLAKEHGLTRDMLITEQEAAFLLELIEKSWRSS